MLITVIIIAIAIFTYGVFGAGRILTEQDDSNQTDTQRIESIVSKLKESQGFHDEFLNINKLVSAQWYPINSSMMIIPLNDNGDYITDEFITKSFAMPFYDNYGMNGSESFWVEEFMTQVNKKTLYNVTLDNFVQKDLVITLEFSDGSKVIFDRYYKEIEENLELYYEYYSHR
jgi:hypothetical protein